MKSLKEQIAGKCVHFNGIMNKRCDAGVSYEDARDTSATPYNFACLRDTRGDSVPCEKREWPSEEYVAKRVAAIKESSNRTIKAMVAAKEDAAAHGLGKGHGGSGSLKCPCCESGTLYYSVAGYNGHMHAKCSTDGCVSWME